MSTDDLLRDLYDIRDMAIHHSFDLKPKDHREETETTVGDCLDRVIKKLEEAAK